MDEHALRSLFSHINVTRRPEIAHQTRNKKGDLCNLLLTTVFLLPKSFGLVLSAENEKSNLIDTRALFVASIAIVNIVDGQSKQIPTASSPLLDDSEPGRGKYRQRRSPFLPSLRVGCHPSNGK